MLASFISLIVFQGVRPVPDSFSPNEGLWALVFITQQQWLGRCKLMHGASLTAGEDLECGHSSRLLVVF
jgi:hypothetical protein